MVGERGVPIYQGNNAKNGPDGIRVCERSQRMRSPAGM